ncbi:PhoU domain protein [Acididesulfobacillus acetoxydans]|uniref:PhoU domain protein n=1 Tax=Acididesulfobacillus acetoxydans TaxID=1561005 RepID=A0A8S0XAC3_9FIRM|nr:PhoU domain protein [Acididesulfobacillus acetoxydans]CEJ06238.1 Phosphate-specific transport system accessory protein PhoU [Acididesulfobacillus acetoxydans]
MEIVGDCWGRKELSDCLGVRKLSAIRMTGYDRALLELRTKSGELAVAVQGLLRRAVEVVRSGSGEPVDWRTADDRVDRLRDAIVERCFTIMSLQQLRTQDLRWILGYQRIAQELERIADYACDLAELSCLHPEGVWPESILAMVRDLLGMFEYLVPVLLGEREIDRDLDEQDDALDRTYNELQQEILAAGRQRPGDGSLAFSLILARTMERMGDHAVNVAEMLVYIKTGQRRLTQRERTPGQSDKGRAGGE